MAEIRHLENRHDVIFFYWVWSDLDKKFRRLVQNDRCRILIRRTFGRIPWHVIPELPATLQGAATWRIQCHDPRAMCHIAGCSHVTKSMSWSCHIAWCNNSIRLTENRFSPYFFCFLMQFGFWRAADFVLSPIQLLLARYRARYKLPARRSVRHPSSARLLSVPWSYFEN